MSVDWHVRWVKSRGEAGPVWSSEYVKTSWISVLDGRQLRSVCMS